MQPLKNDPTRILVVDDHILFRQGLVSLLDKQPDFTVIGEAGAVADAIHLADRLKPEIILMDYSLPDGSGADATRAILHHRPEIQVIFLTIYEDDEYLFESIRSGAKGYLLKNTPVKDLLASLRALQRDEAAISRQMMSRVLDEFARASEAGPANGLVVHPALEGLTRREQEVLLAAASGASNDEIGRSLVISTNTVKNHIHNILGKLGLRNRRELVRFVEQHRHRRRT